jgi:hypothetical protein
LVVISSLVEPPGPGEVNRRVAEAMAGATRVVASVAAAGSAIIDGVCGLVVARQTRRAGDRLRACRR